MVGGMVVVWVVWGWSVEGSLALRGHGKFFGELSSWWRAGVLLGLWW